MIRALLLLSATLLAACGGKDDGIYDTCETAEDCTAPDDLEPACLDKGDEGYCTWGCSTDDDCMGGDTASDGDDSGLERVCASFESEAGSYCFPSCEEDETACPEGMTCRSTGGGSENRKVCFPEE